MKRAASAMDPKEPTSSSNLRRRAAESDVRVSRREIVNCMDQYPDCVEHLRSTLVDLGYFDRDPSSSGGLAKSKHAIAMEKRKEATKAKKEAEKQQQDLEDLLPANAEKLADLPATALLEKVVHPLDTAVYSLPNLRHAMQKCGRNRTKTLMNEIVQNHCGIDESFKIPSGIETYSALVLMLQWMHKELHKCTFKIKMPPRWGSDGNFGIEWHPAVVGDERFDAYPHLRDRASGELVALPRQGLPDFFGPGSLTVDMSFARHAATVKSTLEGVAFGYRCSRLVHVEEPIVMCNRYRIRQLALTNAPSQQAVMDMPTPSATKDKPRATQAIASAAMAAGDEDAQKRTKTSELRATVGGGANRKGSNAEDEQTEEVTEEKTDGEEEEQERQQTSDVHVEAGLAHNKTEDDTKTENVAGVIVVERRDVVDESTITPP
eukprot:TRINITY_DN44176_c0_g1_i1.p1 TRINITY_DN44176_c0_g1~~TRINITY_DN44176_c0_g1_i1.p1  ORF type:complete len:434 (+),score=123.51 TRINITY_DN44176_c0_g1_i1:48-1349(+)